MRFAISSPHVYAVTVTILLVGCQKTILGELSYMVVSVLLALVDQGLHVRNVCDMGSRCSN